MIECLKKFFVKGTQMPRLTQKQYEQHYELKKQGLERVLGEMYSFVGHAIIPF